MADVAVDPQNANPQELYAQGVRAYVLQDYESAVSALSKASALLSAQHKDELHDSLGDVYLYYGKSLLELSRKESGPLGDGVLKNVDEESDEDEDIEAAEEVEEDGDAGGDEEAATAEGSEEAEATNGQKTNEEESADGGKGGKEDGGEKEEEVRSSTSQEATAGASGSGDKKEGEETAEEELTDLQVAWEVLELAKKIFTNRGDAGKKNLSDTLIVLGEVSLEGGNFESAIADMKLGLDIQRAIFDAGNRTIAETHYKLGSALSINGQIDDSIASFKASNECLKKKLDNLQKQEAGDEDAEDIAEEITELNSLIPEIEEKIADMESLKIEMANKVSSTVKESEVTNGNCSSASTSSAKQATDISHLVKRKRKSDEPTSDAQHPAKKPSP